MDSFEPIDHICDDFDSAWQHDELSPVIDNFLCRCADGSKQDLFTALLEIDIEYRLNRSEAVSVKILEERYPDFRHLVAEVLSAVQQRLRNTTQSETQVVDVTVGSQINAYRVDKPLGQGGMGTVFLATNSKRGGRVALKFPRPDSSGELAARFRREARVLSQLDHPNLARIIAIESYHGSDYVVMEFVEGGPLVPPVNLYGDDRLSASLKIMEIIADAIHYAHGLGVVHRDLKPQNILIDLAGQPVVVDFGLARQLNSQDTRLTADDQILGTPAYMAPEQFDQSAGTVGPQSDIFSLGVLLFRLVTGEHPIADNIIGRISGAPENVGRLSQSLPVNVAAICRKAMSWHAADRQETAQQLKQEMAAARQQLPQTPLDNFDDFTTTDSSVTLRVRGTQYGYRLPIDSASISVGRQRRKTPEDQTKGNDFVIRTPASDSDTLRISRKHFRIDRIGREFRIVDLSRNGTMLNNKFLEKGIPTTINDGDELTISGVLVLQVTMTDDAAIAVPCDAVSVLTHGISPLSLELERSIGDLVTFEQ